MSVLRCVAWTFLSKHALWLGHSCPSAAHGQERPCYAVALDSLVQALFVGGDADATRCGLDSLVQALFVGGDADATVAWTFLSKHSRARTGKSVLRCGLDILVQAGCGHGQECPCYGVAWTFLSKHSRARTGKFVLQGQKHGQECPCYKGRGTDRKVRATKSTRNFVPPT